MLFDGLRMEGQGMKFNANEDKTQIANECKNHWVMSVFYEVIEFDKPEGNSEMTQEIQANQENQNLDIGKQKMQQLLTDLFPKPVEQKRIGKGFHYELQSPNKKGRCSECNGCGKLIEKNEERIVHVHYPYAKRREWKKTDKYHCKIECLNIMDDKHKKKCVKRSGHKTLSEKLSVR